MGGKGLSRSEGEDKKIIFFLAPREDGKGGGKGDDGGGGGGFASVGRPVRFAKEVEF